MSGLRSGGATMRRTRFVIIIDGNPLRHAFKGRFRDGPARAQDQ